MTTIPTDFQATLAPPLDADPHPAESHLQDVKVYARALIRYWIDTANWVENIAAGRLVVPVIATCAGIIGAAIIEVNL